MSMRERLLASLAALQPEHLDVLDESHMHSRGQETHYKAVIVSAQFAGLNAVKRHQRVYAALQGLIGLLRKAVGQVGIGVLAALAGDKQPAQRLFGRDNVGVTIAGAVIKACWGQVLDGWGCGLQGGACERWHEDLSGASA